MEEGRCKMEEGRCKMEDVRWKRALTVKG